MCRIFESNWAEKILSSIKKHGEVIAVVSGTMGAIAMMDVGLDKSVRILKERFVEWINRENFNVIVNATYTTSLDRMLADCWHLSRKINLPIIGIDANSKTIAYWRDIRELAECISNDLNFKLIKGVDFGETFWMDGEKEYRRILAVEPEDWILVNGIVVGKATERDVIFVCKNGEILEIKGASIKYHGLKRLGRIDIKNAKIDTVRLLRDKVENRASLSYLPKNIVAFIDHIGYDILRFLEEGICCAVVIGDDTTTIVGDILERFNIPIIGIVDNDRDGLINGAKFSPNSIILKVENDDEFGAMVFKRVFNEKQIIKGDFESIKNKILKLYREIIN